MTLGKLHEQLHTVNKINYWADRDVKVQLFTRAGAGGGDHD